MNKFKIYACLIIILVCQSANAAQVALLIMATGKYISFVDPLIDSAKKYFCKGHNVTYFVFTDAADGLLKRRKNVVYVYQAKLGWPYDTMMRFKTYLSSCELYEGQDYIFACDADMRFVADCGSEIFGDRVAVLHPAFYNKKRASFTYETNPRSKAFIAKEQGTSYFCGGFYGASKKEFLKILEVNSENIEKDLSCQTIAIWHDESHWNRYCVDHPPTVVLNSSYCYPESWKIPFKPILIALNKNHKKMRK